MLVSYTMKRRLCELMREMAVLAGAKALIPEQLFPEAVA